MTVLVTRAALVFARESPLRIAESLDLVELVYNLEEEYSISIDPDVLVELATVEDLLNCIGTEITPFAQ
jgi:acyl carrier protein